MLCLAVTFNCLFEQFLIDFTYVLRFYETFPETTFLNIDYFFLGIHIIYRPISVESGREVS